MLYKSNNKKHNPFTPSFIDNKMQKCNKKFTHLSKIVLLLFSVLSL